MYTAKSETFKERSDIKEDLGERGVILAKAELYFLYNLRVFSLFYLYIINYCLFLRGKIPLNL